MPLRADHKFNKKDVFKVLKEAQIGNLEYLKEFFNNHSIHWTELSYDQTGDTVIHCSARYGHTHVIDYLLTKFVPRTVDCRNKDDKTALHEAAQFSQFKVCEQLLEYGADVNAIKRADWTPLMLSCTKTNNPHVSLKTVKTLLNFGARVNYRNKDGWTCLHLISREGDVDILRQLLEYKLSIHIKTKNGRSALHIAALHGNVEMVKLLLSLGLDVNERDNCGSTPIHEAVLGNHLELCEELIKHKADAYMKNSMDYSLLQLAASEGHIQIVKVLVSELGFDPNEGNKDGLTALHVAARKKQTDVFKVLLELGAKSDVEDKFGRTPMDYLPKPT